METKTCNRCNSSKTLNNFSPASFINGKQYYRGECKECNRTIQKMPGPKAAQKRYRSTDKYKETRQEYRQLPHVKEQEKQYANENKNIINENKRILHNSKYENDELFKLTVLIRQRTRTSLKTKQWKKTNKFKEYIGCSLIKLKQHIEMQFKSGMTWENHGTWEIDHIIPLSSAKTIEKLYELSHYTNLQPLWKLNNRKKSNKISKEYNNV